MATKKSSEKDGRKGTSSKQTGARVLLVTELRRENEKLRRTIDDIWSVLNPINPTGQIGEMYAAICEACDYIQEDLPETYYAEDVEDTPQDVEQLQAAASAVIQERATKKIAGYAGVSVEELANTKDINRVIPALRRYYAEGLGLGVVSDADASDEEYKALVSFYFIMSVIFAARPSCTLKSEAHRFITALTKIKNEFPQARRKPGDDVQTALGILEAGKSLWDAYPLAITKKQYGKDFSEMDKKEKTKARRTLRERVRASTNRRAGNA